MFGHQDSSNKAVEPQPTAPTADGVLSHPVAPQTFAPTADTPTTDNSGFIVTDVTPPVVAEPPADPVPAVAPSAPAVDTPSSDHVRAVASDVPDGLLELKQAALQELTPLIDHLEQTAEEKFRTMMMMIQASDDQTLLSEAYQAAQTIEDPKARAQALLDVVNEINYFTQQHHEDAAA